jgi:CRP/FNR family cyclic AMP-dependent transcriptional regulator
MDNLFRLRTLTPRLERLASLTLFATLNPGELRIVDGLLHQRDYLTGEIVFDEGEEGQAIYIVLDGSVRIGRQALGDEGFITELQPGAFFGDMALLDSSPRIAQARAATNATLAVLFREDFLALMETHARIASKVALQLARQMGARLRQLEDERGAGRR